MNIPIHIRIRIDVGGTLLSATLDDTDVARDFAALLPLDLTLEDYASTEKISDLPRKLVTAGAPAGTAASAGDITYYGPWGNLALFYRAFGYSAGLVKLGRIDSGLAALQRPGPLAVTIQRIER
jgi:hypothetical protein